MNLSRLTSAGRSLVNDDFLANADVVLNLDGEFIQVVDPRIAIDAIAEVVSDTMERFDAFDTRMDAYIAPRLHKGIPITRRLAADSATWHWMSCIAFPEFVRHRWKPSKGKITRERFLGDHVRNTFARLWWGAELSRGSPMDYSTTVRLFSASQDLYEATLGRTFSQHPPALHAFVTLFEKAPEDIFRQVAKKFRCVLSTVLLDSLDVRQIEELLKELKKTVAA